jgi:uncharacterized coiled-coil protein SlyX
MTAGDREGLISRIRRVAAGRDPASAPQGDSRPERLIELETRVTHLEELVEGLQDSVYRESQRHATLIAELQNQVEPSTMRAAIAEDARSRGL